MPKKEKPLPKPPQNPFGHREDPQGTGTDRTALLADRLAAAMAEGRLDEFLKQEMPDNEYARNLAAMMMGMTGMMPPRGATGPQEPQKAEQAAAVQDAANVPDDIRRAAEGGNMQNVIDLLQREHQARNPGAGGPEEKVRSTGPLHRPIVDKEIIDSMIQIAADNGVTLDWIILRAIKLYVQEYQKTGRL